MPITVSEAVHQLHKDAFAMRPSRIVGNELRHYQSWTWDKKPFNMIRMWLNRMRIYHEPPRPDIMIDILNENNDIIQEVTLSKKQFEYLRGKMKFKLDNQSITRKPGDAL